MFNFFLQIKRFLKLKISFLIFRFVKNLFSIVGLDIEVVPYSDWSSKIYLISKKKSENNDFKIKKNFYFKNIVYSQGSDLRGVFKNEWDEESTRILSLFSLNKLFKKLDFFDFGANYGIYSLPFASLDKVSSHVILEANPFLVTCLEMTFSNSKTNIVPMAVTTNDKKEKLLFNVHPFGSGGSALENVKKSPGILSTLQININTISYEYIFEKYKISDNVILKIDIEGSEIHLLKNGLLEYLNKKYKNFIILVEYIPNLYSIDQDLFFKKKLSDYFCLPLSNLNYIYESENKNLQIDFLLESHKVSDFYKINYERGIDWFANEKDLLYSDIIVFSSKKLADQAYELLIN